jgi:hypothetical protein
MEVGVASGDISDFKSQLQNVIQNGGYCDEQVYNCDETALYYRLLPAKSLDVKKKKRTQNKI